MSRAPHPSLRRIYQLGAAPGLYFSRLNAIEPRFASLQRELDREPVLDTSAVERLVAALDLSQLFSVISSVEPPPAAAAPEVRAPAHVRVTPAATAPARRGGVVNASSVAGPPRVRQPRDGETTNEAAVRARSEVLALLSRVTPAVVGGGDRTEPRVARPLHGSVEPAAVPRRGAFESLVRRAERSGAGASLHSVVVTNAPVGASLADDPRAAPRAPSVAPGSERAVTSAARLESALVRLAAARRERTASTKATPTAARGLPLGSEGSSGGVAPSLGGGLQALAARFGTPESDGARPMPTSESSRQDPSARRAATGFEDGAEALPPLPRPLLERLSRNELTRRLDEILRHEAERSGVDFNRRMP